MELVDLAAFGDVVALVEDKARLEHVLAEPNATESVQQPFVIVVGHTASVLDLSKHVPHTNPVDALQIWAI